MWAAWAAGVILAGQGTAVDWLVEMERFDQEALFDRRAAEGRRELESVALAGMPRVVASAV